jgi:protein-S-isoprenylcysteine O-methyltransferase Ste14
MQVANRMASVVAGTTIGAGDFHGMRIQLVGDAVAAIVVLLVATALSVFKPQGLTPFGRNQSSRPDEFDQTGTPRWVRVFGITVAVVLIALVLIKHLAGGGLSHHMR